MARAHARTVYLTYGAGFGFATRLMWTTYIVFATVELGLDPLQLVSAVKDLLGASAFLRPSPARPR